MSKKALIIGAGYGGMALANLLGKAGYEVNVYEKNSEPGGRIAAFKSDGFTFDIGPSWYLMPEVFDDYYKIFNQSAEKRLNLIRFTPGYKVYFETGKPIVIQGDVEKDASTFESIETGAGSVLKKYIKKSSKAYDVATKYFLYTNFQDIRDFLHLEIFRHGPSLLPLVFQNLDRYVSKYFSDSRLKKILEYHMVFIGSSPFQAPALYTLMSSLDFRSGVYYPKKGMYSLVSDLQKLGSKFNITYHYNTPVKRIMTKNNHATGVEFENGQIAKADLIISNADLHFTETQLLKPEFQTYPESHWNNRQPGPGALMISLGVKAKIPQLMHHTLFFVDKWRENFKAIYEDMEVPEHASIYVCNPSKTDPKLAPTDHENIFILVPLPAGISLNKSESNKLSERIITQLETMAGIKNLKKHIVSKHIFGTADFSKKYNAWSNNAFGGESHILKQSIIFRTNNQSKKLNNLYYVGAGTLPGIGLPMCLMSAQLAYKKIVGDMRGGPVKEINEALKL